jgi:hypothetical protein
MANVPKIDTLLNPICNIIKKVLNKKMSSNIVSPASFDVSEVTFRAPKVLDSGGKIVSLDYSGRRLMVQSPSMHVPYGLNVFDKAGPPSYSVDLSFRGVEENPRLKSFYDMLVAFDERLVSAGVENSLAWFKMPNASREVIKAFYTPSIKVSLDREGKPKPYPPTLKTKLPKKNGTFETEFYNSEKRPYEGVSVEDLLVKGSYGTFLLQCTGIWFAGSKFGATWKAIQVRMDSVPSGLGRGCAIMDDEEGSVMAAVMPVKRATAPAAAAAAPAEEEDEEEEADEDEEEVVEAPVVPKKVAAPVKKVVKKTTK